MYFPGRLLRCPPFAHPEAGGFSAQEEMAPKFWPSCTALAKTGFVVISHCSLQKEEMEPSLHHVTESDLLQLKQWLEQFLPDSVKVISYSFM
ncbi:hypothetical protein PoB_002182700 [Plakobranchus ocellatus]|uniref:Uncharacterized protein n=1 Tax=Plakobranchus ocellatus TaxID=259542 RepID=A0AAV3ZL43_9GAST|nr:hypothetical protein PoB_002182700 [Plakobranchus ocellatus]